MAQLSSPGVSVTVIDESFYTPSAPGTVPLIIVASGENKANSAGTGIAPGTLKANAGKVYLLTSQMDLGATFGIPYFQTDANNNPVHAGEINEYGLQAAYSFLGVSNRAYVVRADLNTSQLVATSVEPAGNPANGTFWFDTTASKYGVFEWNAAPASSFGGQTFSNKIPTVITDTTKVVNFGGGDYTPKASIGAVGDYAIVAVSSLYKLWYKKPATTLASPAGWVEVGTTNWVASNPVVTGASTASYGAGETLVISGETVTNGGTTQASMAVAINAKPGLIALGITAGVTNGFLNIYSTGVPVSITGGTGLSAAGLTTGTYNAPALTISAHTQPPQYKVSGDKRPTGSIWVKTTTPNLGANYVVKTYNGDTDAWVEQTSPFYANSAAALASLDPAGGGLNLAAGATFVKYNDSEASPAEAAFKVYVRRSQGVTSITSKTFTMASSGTTLSISETLKNEATPVAKSVSISINATAPQIADAINAAGFTNIIATSTPSTLTLTHILGGNIYFDSNALVSTLFGSGNSSVANFYDTATGHVTTLWSSVDSTGATIVTASPDALTAEPADGQLWYNSTVSEVDIMVHNGTKWVGYKNMYSQTNAAGPQVSATEPTTQSDGTTPLKDNDLWISTADLENYPMIYRYNETSKAWTLLDNTDQTTEDGVLFHDARWNDTGKSVDQSPIVDLLTSNYVDFDAPDPALYPRGMLLWNLRRSGNNVLRYARNYVDPTAANEWVIDPGTNQPEIMEEYVTSKWVSEAPNSAKGAGQFGRKAQRAVVLKSLNALIQENQAIRDEDSRVFNLIACPGYLEATPALNALNADRGLLSFIVADAPARLTPDATSLADWGNNVNNATGDGEEGLISTDPYSAVYYPWGYTTDLNGNNIAVPPSHIMLRTIALSDNVSYPWFAPAGTRRGGASNVSSVGYVDAEGEFVPVALNNGQRDTLASINVNPITYIGGVGLVAYGQKTRQLVASALDRINVARLVIYLRYQLNQLAKPFIFEPNDTITRNEMKQQVEKLLLELTGQRALYDYLVVCDTSNNTPARIDRNELHVDIAIEPVKAVEFIYIPLRLENTGAIKGLGQ